MKMLSTTELNDQKSIKSIDSVGSFGVSDPLALPVSFDCDSSDSPSVFCIITCLSFVWQLLSVLAMCLLMAGALSPNWINRPLSGVYLTFDNLRLPSALPAHHPMAAPISSSSSSMSSSASAFIPSSSSLFSESGDQAAFLHPSILAPEDRHTLSAEHESTGAALLLSSLGAFGGCTGLTSEQQTWPAGCRISVRSALEHTQRVDFLWYCGQLAQLLGIFVFFIALTGALVSTCKQSVRRKSVFTIVGTCQAFAGLLHMIGLILYTAGLGDPLSKSLCGTIADPFWLGHCKLGFGFGLSVAGNLLVFVCASLSVQVDQRTSSDRVQSQALKGRRCICIF